MPTNKYLGLGEKCLKFAITLNFILKYLRHFLICKLCWAFMMIGLLVKTHCSRTHWIDFISQFFLSLTKCRVKYEGKYLFCNWHLLLYLCSFVMFCTLTKYLYVRFRMCSVLCILVNHRFIWFVTHLTTPRSWFLKLYCTTIFVFVFKFSGWYNI